MKLLAVNDRAWTPKLLKEALTAAKSSDRNAPINLLFANDEYFKTFSIDYHEGERYPHLERAASKPDLLEDICRPHAAGKPRM